MMNSGHFGSQSFSNLSPLAPPFTVDRSNLNKHTLNSTPISNFNDPTSYSAVPFTPPSLAFNQSTGVHNDFFGDSQTSANDYGYVLPDPAVSSPVAHNWGGSSSNGSGQITNWSHFSAVNPNPKRVVDSSFYNHPPYDLSVKIDDNDLVRVSDETDYTRILSGLEYSPNPNPNFNPKLLPEEKLVERLDAGIADSFGYDKCLNQGDYYTETLRKGKDDSSMLYYADMIRKANNSVKSDGTSFSANNHRLEANEFSKEESHFRAFPMSSEAYTSLIHSPADPFGNSQKLTPQNEKRYHHKFDYMLKSKKASPIVIKPPSATVSSFSASRKSLEIGNNAGVSKISDVVVDSSHKSLKEKEEFHLPQLSFQMGTTNAAPSSIKDTKLSSASDQPKFEFKSNPSFVKVPDINISDAASSLDHHNPAEDSPCWKGTHFLPFGSPQTQPSTKKPQIDTNIQETDSYSHNKHRSDEKPSSSHIPKNDTSEVVESSKARDGRDDSIKPNKPQTLKMDLPNLEEAADKKLNTSILVNTLHNLSDLLLWACSNEELKEHDRDVLDRVTCNLDACMSRQVQSNISKESQVINGASGTLQDGGQHARDQKMKSDVFGESVKNLREHASLRDLDPPKGDNMVQAIKKVLDENLESEGELSSETTLMYKNLWLEAEAELCCLSYRARLERFKRESHKENPHILTAAGDVPAIEETLKSCNGSTFLKTDNSRVSNAQHVDNAINVHGEQNPVKEGHDAGVKVTGSGVTVLHPLCEDDNDDGGVDSWVIARSNTLKHKGGSNTIDLEEGACGEVRENHFKDEAAAAAEGSGSDWEHILKDELGWRLS